MNTAMMRVRADVVEGSATRKYDHPPVEYLPPHTDANIHRWVTSQITERTSCISVDCEFAVLKAMGDAGFARRLMQHRRILGFDFSLSRSIYTVNSVGVYRRSEWFALEGAEERADQEARVEVFLRPAAVGSGGTAVVHHGSK